MLIKTTYDNSIVNLSQAISIYEEDTEDTHRIIADFGCKQLILGEYEQDEYPVFEVNEEEYTSLYDYICRELERGTKYLDMRFIEYAICRA